LECRSAKATSRGRTSWMQTSVDARLLSSQRRIRIPVAVRFLHVETGSEVGSVFSRSMMQKATMSDNQEVRDSSAIKTSFKKANTTPARRTL
jgi:hypothetical protein